MNFWNKIKAASAKFMLNCQEAVRAQSEALDHPLPPLKRFGLRLHLLICEWCRRYGKQIRFLREAAHDHQKEFIDAAPQGLSTEVRERIKQQLRENK